MYWDAVHGMAWVCTGRIGTMHAAGCVPVCAYVWICVLNRYLICWGGMSRWLQWPVVGPRDSALCCQLAVGQASSSSLYHSRRRSYAAVVVCGLDGKRVGGGGSAKVCSVLPSDGHSVCGVMV